MLNLLLSTILASCLVLQAISASGADEAKIRQIVADQVIAWNAGDAKAFSARFAKEGSFTNIRGTIFYGHQAFLDRHIEIFEGGFKGSKLTMEVTRVRFVRPDVAIVDIGAQVSNFKGLPPGVKPAADGTVRTQLQQVYVKGKDGWWIESYHNVDVK